jgi:hypothetical protein
MDAVCDAKFHKFGKYYEPWQVREVLHQGDLKAAFVRFRGSAALSCNIVNENF